MIKEALFQEQVKGGNVRCMLCPSKCLLQNGQKGRCGARFSDKGRLFTSNYGDCSSLGLDPVEKKPLYHFYPGRNILSAGSTGCNFSCPYCQNHAISQGRAITEYRDPRELAGMALQKGSIGLAYTYNEPVIWYEFVKDTAGLVKDRGGVNVLVTNGYINPEPLRQLLPLIDAMNIDVKAFNSRFYRKLCGGVLDNVRSTVEYAFGKCHLELTYLVIPGWNDAPGEIASFAKWVAGLSPSIPVHFSRYFPRYKFTTHETPEKTMEEAAAAAAAHLKFVYIGNMDTRIYTDTLCPSCRSLLIKRRGYSTDTPGLDGVKCSKCGEAIYGKN